MTRNTELDGVEWLGTASEYHANVDGFEFRLRAGLVSVWHLYKRSEDGQFGYCASCLWADRSKAAKIAARVAKA